MDQGCVCVCVCVCVGGGGGGGVNYKKQLPQIYRYQSLAHVCNVVYYLDVGCDS